jgi:hypothetical protein
MVLELALEPKLAIQTGWVMANAFVLAQPPMTLQAQELQRQELQRGAETLLAIR